MVVRPPPKWKVASSSLATPVSQSRRSCSRAAALCCQEETRCAASNNRAIVYYPQLKTPWYKQAWFLGLFLGNFAGLLLLCGSSPIPRRFLESAFPYTAFGYYFGDFFIIAGTVFGMFVGPAIVSGAAGRSYMFAGLLPLLLFFMWDFVAVIVAPFPINLSGGVIMLTLIICWGISLCPSYMIRRYRRRRREPVLPVAVYVPKPLPRRRLVAASLITFGTALVLLGWYNFNHLVTPRIEVRTSWPLGATTEAHIPIVVHDRNLYITARLNGKEELCRVDTGANSVEWPRRLHLRGSMTKEYGQSCGPTEECVDTQTMVLPYVRIGGCEVNSLPTEVVGADLDPLSISKPAYADNAVNLGNVAFVQTVFTVDYRKKELILRPPKYDFTRQQRRAGDRVLQMKWMSDFSDKERENKFSGFPAIQVSLAGALFWCALDTGWGAPEIGLTEDFVSRHPSVGHVKHDLAQFGDLHGSMQVERLHDLHVTLPCLWPPHTAPISLRMNGLVTPTLYGGEGVIGLALMERYRITIDYGRRRVLLEPYAPVKSQIMQEKTATKAKPTGI